MHFFGSPAELQIQESCPFLGQFVQQTKVKCHLYLHIERVNYAGENLIEFQTSNSSR